MCCFCCCRPRHRDLDDVVYFSDAMSDATEAGVQEARRKPNAATAGYGGTGGAGGQGGGGGGVGLGEVTANPLVRMSQAEVSAAL